MPRSFPTPDEARAMGWIVGDPIVDRFTINLPPESKLLMSHTYTTAAEDARKVRAALKKQLGATGREISVRSDTYSMGSSIDVDVKAPGYALARVKAIVSDCNVEHVRRCEFSGEILSGGNRYVRVSLGWEYIQAVKRAALPEITAAMEAAEADPNRYKPVGTKLGVEVCYAGGNEWRVTTEEETHGGRHVHRDGVAEAVASRLAERGVDPAKLRGA